MIQMKRNKNCSSFLIAGGLILWAAAFLLTAYNIFDAHRAERAAQTALNDFISAIAKNESLSTEDEIPDYVRYPDMEMPVLEVDGQKYIGVLSLPSIEVELPVISSWDYEKLKLAPCRYAGSAYKDTMVVAAHNYPSHFGKLEKLSIGDTVIFTDTDGNEFQYQVADFEWLPADAKEDMLTGEWDFTMFTCTTSGQKRLTVRCMRIQES